MQVDILSEKTKDLSKVSFEEFSKQSKSILQELATNKQLLEQLLLDLPRNEELFSYSEHYDILDKIVLFINSDLQIRLRLHVFADDYYDRPHNHRWSYSSYILSGGYLHTIFAPDSPCDEIGISELYPIMIRQEEKGNFYTLHHSQYHSVVASPGTVTLVLRGSSVKERFRVMDRATHASWWQYGAQQEENEEKQKKRMNFAQYEKTLQRLYQLQVL
jgi:hypothetical protein